jgi:hypothetical protein
VGVTGTENTVERVISGEIPYFCLQILSHRLIAAILCGSGSYPNKQDKRFYFNEKLKPILK